MNYVRQENGVSRELAEYLTFGELAGRIPSSLIPKVDFQRFIKNNKLPPMEEQAVTSIQKETTAEPEIK